MKTSWIMLNDQRKILAIFGLCSSFFFLSCILSQFYPSMMGASLSKSLLLTLFFIVEQHMYMWFCVLGHHQLAWFSSGVIGVVEYINIFIGTIYTGLLSLFAQIESVKSAFSLIQKIAFASYSKSRSCILFCHGAKEISTPGNWTQISGLIGGRSSIWASRPWLLIFYYATKVFDTSAD